VDASQEFSADFQIIADQMTGTLHRVSTCCCCQIYSYTIFSAVLLIA